MSYHCRNKKTTRSTYTKGEALMGTIRRQRPLEKSTATSRPSPTATEPTCRNRRFPRQAPQRRPVASRPPFSFQGPGLIVHACEKRQHRRRGARMKLPGAALPAARQETGRIGLAVFESSNRVNLAVSEVALNADAIESLDP